MFPECSLNVPFRVLGFRVQGFRVFRVSRVVKGLSTGLQEVILHRSLSTGDFAHDFNEPSRCTFGSTASHSQTRQTCAGTTLRRDDFTYENVVVWPTASTLNFPIPILLLTCRPTM